MSKRIFFLLPSFYIGGVEKSFVNLVDSMSKDEYEIHLGLLDMGGNYMSALPDYVTVHHVDCSRSLDMLRQPFMATLMSQLRGGHPLRAFRYGLAGLDFKMRKTNLSLFKCAFKDVPTLPGRYDIAVAYAGPSPLIDYYIAKKVVADRKIAWIHFDISKYGCDNVLINSLYKDFDYINVVSHTAKHIFDDTFPRLRDKTKLFYNIVNRKTIVSLGNVGDTFAPDAKGLRILTVGRLSYEKGQQTALQAAKLLKDAGIDFVWYFVGDGAQMAEFEALAESYGLADRTVFTGAKDNPYGYFKHCDVYVQPSKHEGFCITLSEALCFDCRIVSTDFCGAREQLDGKPNVIICESTADSIADAIRRTIN